MREALKETLAKNVAKNSDDIAETIQQINDGEILDTFNDESDTLSNQKNQQSYNHIPNNSNSISANHGFQNRPDDRSDTVSLPGERASRRKLLGDRELMLKKNKLATQDLSESNENVQNGGTDEEFGDGLFDRFSLARKTLNRNSIR